MFVVVFVFPPRTVEQGGRTHRAAKHNRAWGTAERAGGGGHASAPLQPLGEGVERVVAPLVLRRDAADGGGKRVPLGLREVKHLQPLACALRLMWCHWCMDMVCLMW